MLDIAGLILTTVGRGFMRWTRGETPFHFVEMWPLFYDGQGQEGASLFDADGRLALCLQDHQTSLVSTCVHCFLGLLFLLFLLCG